MKISYCVNATNNAAQKGIDKNMKKLFCYMLFFSSFSSWSDYNANMKGVIRTLAVYADADYIYLQLENQPDEHPTCNPVYFVIHESVQESRRQMLLSRLSMAYASKEEVNIGFDSQGNCAHGYIRVHRAG